MVIVGICCWGFSLDGGELVGIVEIGDADFAAAIRALVQFAGGGNGDLARVGVVELQRPAVAHDPIALLVYQRSLSVDRKFAVAGIGVLATG